MGLDHPTSRHRSSQPVSPTRSIPPNLTGVLIRIQKYPSSLSTSCCPIVGNRLAQTTKRLASRRPHDCRRQSPPSFVRLRCWAGARDWANCRKR